MIRQDVVKESGLLVNKKDLTTSSMCFMGFYVTVKEI